MSNEELKLEAIKNAYGEYYKSCHPDINGWSNIFFNGVYSILESKGEIETFKDGNTWRPKSLSGLENNRGWIRIESQEQYDELKNGSYFWYNIDNGRYDSGDLWEYGVFTHYQPIIKPENPLW